MILTEHGHQSSGGRSLPGHVGGHAAVVRRVGELGLQDQEAARAADDEVGVRAGVYRDSVPQPGHDLGVWPASGRMAAEFSLASHLYVGVVGWSLKIFTQI